jgi:hypothetical protein
MYGEKRLEGHKGRGKEAVEPMENNGYLKSGLGGRRGCIGYLRGGLRSRGRRGFGVGRRGDGGR